jgi:nitrate reductase (NAD(P)H)
VLYIDSGDNRSNSTHSQNMSLAAEKAGVPLPPPSATQPKAHAAATPVQLPPTPPGTDVDSEDGRSTPTELDVPLPPQTAIQSVLDIDKPTPDAHVPRDPRLIRLTGTHPFNVEAPLSDLYNEGFLTSPELFYVRNHGAVPEVQDEECLDWEFSVEGYGLCHASPFRLTHIVSWLTH